MRFSHSGLTTRSYGKRHVSLREPCPSQRDFSAAFSISIRISVALLRRQHTHTRTLREQCYCVACRFSPSHQWRFLVRLAPAGGTQQQQDHFLHMSPFLLFISRLTGYSDHHRGELEMRERLVPAPTRHPARTLASSKQLI